MDRLYVSGGEHLRVPTRRRRFTLHCCFDPPYSVPQRNISSFAQFIPSLLSLNPRDLEKTARRAMAENVPPAGTAAKPPASGDRPGLPYYEKLRRDLRDTLQKKRLLDRNMVRRCAASKQIPLTRLGCR
jgi:hypothetical protein